MDILLKIANYLEEEPMLIRCTDIGDWTLIATDVSGDAQQMSCSLCGGVVVDEVDLTDMKKGKLIVIEGSSDGIGKTTQFNLLKQRLLDENIKVESHHFPSYNTYQGKPVEEYLKGTFGKPDQLSPYFVNSLYAVDRAITWNIDLKKKFEQGDTILLDRYTTSSLIY